MALEVLHGALVLLGRRARLEGAEVAAPAGLWVHLARIEAIAARRELADHRRLPRAARPLRTLRFAARLCAALAIANLLRWLLLSTAARGLRFHISWQRRAVRKCAGAGNACRCHNHDGQEGAVDETLVLPALTQRGPKL